MNAKKKLQSFVSSSASTLKRHLLTSRRLQSTTTTPISTPKKKTWKKILLLGLGSILAYEGYTIYRDCYIGIPSQLIFSKHQGDFTQIQRHAPEEILTIDYLLSRCPAILTSFKPTPYLRNAHLQNIVNAKFRSLRESLSSTSSANTIAKDLGTFTTNPEDPISIQRRAVTLPDGFTVYLDWVTPKNGSSRQELPPVSTTTSAKPTLFILPGIYDGTEAAGVKHLITHASTQGMQCVVLNFSDKSSNQQVKNVLPGVTHGAKDLHPILESVRQELGKDAAFVGVGLSVGGNILVRYLGELGREGTPSPLDAAISISNPFDLSVSMNHIHNSQLYRYLYDKDVLQKRIDYASRVLPNLLHHLQPMSVNTVQLEKSRDLKHLQEEITKLSSSKEYHEKFYTLGSNNLDHFYKSHSSKYTIRHVPIPLLNVNAKDDPISPADTIPIVECMHNRNLAFLITSYGGHYAYLSGAFPFSNTKPTWIENIILQYASTVQEFKNQQASHPVGQNNVGKQAAIVKQ